MFRRPKQKTSHKSDMTNLVHSPHQTQKVTEVQDKCPKMGDPSQYRYIVLQPSCKTSKHQKLLHLKMNLHCLSHITKYKSFYMQPNFQFSHKGILGPTFTFLFKVIHSSITTWFYKATFFIGITHLLGLEPTTSTSTLLSQGDEVRHLSQSS